MFKELTGEDLLEVNGGGSEQIEEFLEYMKVGVPSLVAGLVTAGAGLGSIASGGAALLMGGAIILAQDSGCTKEGQKKYLPYEWAD